MLLRLFRSTLFILFRSRRYWLLRDCIHRMAGIIKLFFMKNIFLGIYFVVSTMAVMLLAGLTTTVMGQPLAETGPKKEMLSEWIDQDTHHMVVRLSRKEGNNLSFYFH